MFHILTHQHKLHFNQFRWFSTESVKELPKNTKKASRNPNRKKVLKKIQTVTKKQNPLLNVITEKMDLHERYDALMKLKPTTSFSEGFAMILADPVMEPEATLLFGKQLEIYKRILQKIPSGTQKAFAVMTGIDELMRQEGLMVAKEAMEAGLPHKMSCHAGCSACCHRLIGITSDEATVLLSQLKTIEKGSVSTETLKKLEKQAEYELGNEDWPFLPKAKTRCVFLNDHGFCKVYDHRPVACRTHQVFSDPWLCNPTATRADDEYPEHVWYPHTEALASAAITVDKDKYNTLPKAILAEHEKDVNTKVQELHSVDTGMDDITTDLVNRLKSFQK